MTLSAGRWQGIERQFLPLLITTLLPILLLPGTAGGDPVSRWLLFTLMALIVVQSLRTLPAISPGDASYLRVQIYRLLGVVALGTGLVYGVFGETNPATFRALLLPLALFFVVTSMRLIRLLARVPRVNLQVMAGAAAGYLLIGLTGGVLATATVSFAPGAFLFGTNTGHQVMVDRLTYFSFITLAGLGYGDVLPGNVFGERFAILLSITGTLYVALLVGLLLGRYISSEEVRFLELEEEGKKEGRLPE